MALRNIQTFIILTLAIIIASAHIYADEDYKYALALMKERKEYKNAADKFDEFLKNNPQNPNAPKALFYMASCLARSGKDTSAANAYEKLITLYKTADESLIIDSYAYGADAYFRAKLYKKASELYQKLIANYPDSKPAESSLYWLAECYNRLALSGSHNTGNQYYQKAISTYSELYNKYSVSRFLPDALTSAGILAYNFKDYQNSAFFFSLFEEVDFELEPEKQELITYYAAESLYWLKDYKAASKRFETIIDAYPDSKFTAESNAGLGWCYYSLGNASAAADSFKKAASAYSTPLNSINSHFDAAAAYEEAGEKDKAIEEYTIVINADSHPKKQAALVRLGILRKDSADPEVSALLDQAFKADSNNSDQKLSIEAGILLADKKFDNNEYSEAAEIFTRIIKIAPNSEYAPYSLYQLALARSKLKQYKKASTAIKLLLKNYPDTPLRLQAAYAIADYQNILGDREKSNIAYKWLANESENWADNFLNNHTVDNPEKFKQDAKDIAAASLLRLAEVLFKDKDNASSQSKAKNYFADYINRYPDNPRLAAALLRLGELTESENTEIAHTYFKNAISSAENFLSTNSADAEFLDIIMHAKYRLCLNNILLSQRGNLESSDNQQQLDNTLKSINAFLAEYKDNDKAAKLVAQIQYYKSETEYSLGNINEALKGYEESYQINKDSSIADAALFSSAWIDQKNGNTQSATKKLKSLLINYSKSEYCCNALYILAINSYNNDKIETAENFLNQLLSNYPDSEFSNRAMIELAKIQTSKNNNEEAIKLLNQILTNPDAPEYPDALYSLSKVYWSSLNQDADNKSKITENRSKTIELLTELLNKYPDYKHAEIAKFRLGELAYNQKLYEDAITWYKTLTTPAPSNRLTDKAHYRLAWCYLKLSETDKSLQQNALDEFTIICNQYPQSKLAPESALRAAKILRDSSRYTEALALYRQAGKNTSKESIIMGAKYGQGITLLQLEEYSKALRTFKEYITEYPGSPLIHEANWGAGQSALMLGAIADAKDYFNLSKADNYNGEVAAKARYGLGIIAMETNELKKAREEFRKVDIFHPQWKNVAAQALLKAAEASKELGEIDPAKNDLKRIIEMYAETPSAQTAEELLLSEAE